MTISFKQHLVFLGTDNLQQAREFYETVLGLNCIHADGEALTFKIDDTTLRISLVENFKPQLFTVFGWMVSDIEQATETIISAGITPNRYPNMPQDELGIATLGTMKIVWFNDSAGNVLSFTEI